MERDEFLTKRGRYLYIIFTTKNEKTKNDYIKALDKLEKKRKSHCYKTGEHWDKEGNY